MAKAACEMDDIDSRANGKGQGSGGLISLAPDLESSALARFDHMVSTGQITFGSSTGEMLEDEGFKVSQSLSLLGNGRQEYPKDYLQ